MKYIYTGDQSEQFPTLGRLLQKGDTFDSDAPIINPHVSEIEDVKTNEGTTQEIEVPTEGVENT